MDYTIPGEFDFNLPDTTMLNTVWTSMLFGVQTQFYTGEMNVSTPEFYDKALSRGSLAYLFLFGIGTGGGNTSSFSYNERKMWMKYMTPLRIYNIEDSMIHHPFDGDYSSYADVDTDDVFGIIYRRPGDVLLVVTKENTALSGTEVQITLEANALGLSGDVLIFDATKENLGGDITSQTVQPDGTLGLTLELEDGPSIFRILNQPSPPFALWHEPAIWSVSLGDSEGNLAVVANGVPHSKGKVLLWYGDSGLPGGLEGAELVANDSASDAAILALEFDENAVNTDIIVVIEDDEFLRADSNSDGSVNLPDAQFTLNFLFLGGATPKCMASADANADGNVNLPDAQYTLNFLFLGGPSPRNPFPLCGVGGDSDKQIGCAVVPVCQ